VKIMDFLNRDMIEPDLKAKTKEDVINEMVGRLSEFGARVDTKTTVASILEREELGSTGLANGIALPHSRTKGVDELHSVLGISKNGIDFDASNGEKTFIFFLLLAPENATGVMLKALDRASKFLMNKNIRAKILTAKNREEILAIIDEEERFRQ
jgi:mannitol/fructose-specific phosphotransferase system IIA component (Ntr-type)